MEFENKKSTFVRDLIVRVLLIVLFIFLLMYLFPMPNLNAFYDSVFNDNIQTMKDAAEKWYSTDRMPKEVGETSELTLQDMIDKKLVLPFVDKDGNSCDTNSSYVQVKKTKKEYVLKVSLTCGNETNYIIEHIGCYNFCKDEKCTQVIQNQTENEPVQNSVAPSYVATETPSTTHTNNPGGGTTPSNPTNPGKPSTPVNPIYKNLYEYSRAKTSETWTLLDWQNNAMEETENLKLVDTNVEYTGQKKITQGTSLYKHIKYAYKDNWSVDSEWSNETKQVSDNVKLYASRTLYTGQKQTVSNVTKYRHVKTSTADNWTTTDWTNQIKATGPNVKLISTRYKVQKTKQNITTKPVTTTKTYWGNWTKDYVWRSSKPSDTSSKQWGSAWDSRTVGQSTSTTTNKIKINDDFKSVVPLSNNSTYTYVFTRTSMDPCTSACNGKATIRVYHYIQYKNVTSTSTSGGSTQYRYYFRVKKTSTQTTNVDSLGNQNTDTKWVTTKAQLQKYISEGYMLVETQYKYKVNKGESTSDYVWTETSVAPEGYSYTGQSTVQTITKYEQLQNWVTSTNKLGEYTSNITKVNQYKYKYNNPTKYIEDTVWTESKTSPNGYTYTGQITSNQSTSYADLGKWVKNRQELGEYKYNVISRKVYQYKRRTTSTVYETKWFEKDPGGDWKATGNSKTIQVN